MSLEIEGKIHVICKAEGGVSKTTGKDWFKQSFVIETFGEYPKKVMFTTWKKDTLNGFVKGSLIRVQFSPESREFNERWYTDLIAKRIESLGTTENKTDEQQQSEPVNTDEPPTDESNPLPF